MDAWDLQADFDKGGKARFDSFSQSQQWSDTQAPLFAASQASEYASQQPCWSQALQQPPPRQPALPNHAGPDWTRRPLPASQRQPAAGRSLLGRPPAAACTPPAVSQPHKAAAPSFQRVAGSMPEHTLQPASSCQMACKTPAAVAPPQPQAAAMAAPSAVPVSSMSLEAYSQIHSLLTGGHSTVQQLHASQSGAIRSQDIKQVLFMHGHAVGSRTKQDTLDKMVGLPLSSMQHHITAQTPQQVASRHAGVDADDLAALGWAAPSAPVATALQFDALHAPAFELPAAQSQEDTLDPATGPAQPASDAPAAASAESEADVLPAALCPPDRADSVRKRKASGLLSGQAAGKARCRGAAHQNAIDDDLAPEPTASFQQGSVVWVTMGAKKWPALMVNAATMQAGETEPQAHVQLFATGIKTVVKLHTIRRFCSTDACTDASALAQKAFDAARKHRNCVSAEE